jgi:hypothetical protein
MPNPGELYLCAWGDIRLYASKCNWNAGNTLVVHDLASGNAHPVQDRGDKANRTKLTVQFDDFPDATVTGAQAYRALRDAARRHERRLFIHPMDGAFFALVGDFDPAIDESSVTTAEIEFVFDGDSDVVVQPAGIGTSAAAGEGAVSAAADALDQELANIDHGFDPGVPGKIDFSQPVQQSIDVAFDVDVNADVSVSANFSASASANASASATATAAASASAAADASAMAFAGAYARASAAVAAGITAGLTQASGNFAFAYASAALTMDARLSAASWNTGDPPTPRKVLTDAARISDSINLMIGVGQLEQDLLLWPAFVAAIQLGAAIRSAAQAATADTPRLFTMRVLHQTSLLPLAARVYGGAAAQDRARQIAQLNDIATQGWLDPGDYVMPARQSGGFR